jgi:hypothetical protein
MAPERPKPDIADFFRPYAKPNPPKTIPAKRPSPTPGDQRNGASTCTDKQLKLTEPRTPLTASRFKDELLSPTKSPFGPRSGTSVTIPIRSPKPTPSQSRSQTLATNCSALGKGPLFAPIDRQKDEEKKPLSFADIPTSGQSIVKDGKIIAVRSSDDEDSDSLCSLDDILGRNRHDAATGSSSPPDVEEDLEAQRARSLSVFTRGRSNAIVGRDKLRELASKANGLNFDISLLVDDHFVDEDVEMNITKAKQGYKVSDDREKLERQGLMDKHSLASVLDQKEGSDNVQRLFNAVERTDALVSDPTWSMFDFKPIAAHSFSSQLFPRDVIQSESWFECLKDSASRNRAYVSGFVAEKAAEGSVPDDLLTWTFNSIAREPRDDLRKSFVGVVKAASQRWTPKNLTPSLIQQTFCQLGADPAMVKCCGEIKAQSKAPADYNAAVDNQLLCTIETLLGLTTDMTQETFSYFFKLLMRLAIDTHLMRSSRICVVVEDAISSLLGHSEGRVSTSAAEGILKDIGLRVKAPFLQTQALKHVLPTSPSAASLRIQLANVFLHGAEDENAIHFNQSSSGSSLQQLTTHLQDPRYDISRSTRHNTPFDYSTFSSSIYIFDAALANGGCPSTFPDPHSERAFNRQVDILAERVKSIITSIADTGASHMRRTEAKEALNALHFRLLYGVRTKPRPKKSVFGGRDGGEYRAEERSKGMMQQFLERRKEERALKGRHANVGPRRDLGVLSSQKSESEELIRKQLGLGS